jgi:hypothetical protein
MDDTVNAARSKAIRRLAAAFAVACLFAAVATASADTSARFRWAIVKEKLQATTDGGHHWRVIFAPQGPIWTQVQMGAESGFASEGDPLSSDTFWTIDNGRHWFYAPTIHLRGSGLSAQGSQIFWSRTSGDANGLPSPKSTFSLFQVNWPPTAANRKCLKGKGPEGYCASALPIKSTRVANRTGWLLTGALEEIPGGVAALLQRAPGKSQSPQFQLLLRRSGRNTLSSLPDASASARDALGGAEISLVVGWPSIVVVANNSERRVLVVWKSTDGGQTWELDEAS